MNMRQRVVRIQDTGAKFAAWFREQLTKYNMSSDETLIQFCAYWESFKPRWYRCSSGVWTIGYGYTGPRDAVRPEPWSEPYARQILTDQLRGSYRRQAEEALLKCGIRLVDLPITAQWAVISRVHNGGPGSVWLRECKPATWVTRFLAHEPRERVKEAWYTWNKSDGKTSPGLVRRRFAEMRLFWDGEVDYEPQGWRDYYEAHR